MAGLSKPLQIFCSFAPEDERLYNQLRNHLRLLEREEALTLWHPRLITAGTDWAKTIDEQLASASIILLLISPAFFASDYCYGVEMRQAMKRHERGEARVIPLLLRQVDWTFAPFARLSVLPSNNKAVTKWRNRDTAFADIVTGIRRVMEELAPASTNLSTKKRSTVWTVPFSRHPFFTGQETLLTQIAALLKAEQSAVLSQPQAISGLGGIGKTQIAIEYAWRHRQDYQAILWCRADTNEALVSSYVALAGHLELAEKEENDQTIIVQAVLHWLSTHTEWLLILDNVNDFAVLEEFLPQERLGHVLLTTRAQATGTQAHPLQVEALAPDVGATLLLRRARLIAPDAPLNAALSADVTVARDIAEELGGLPLALDQAGAYIEETRCGLVAYLSRYRSQPLALLKRRGGSARDYPTSVATTWLLSFEKVERQNPAAADLLRCCAFLHPDAIPEELFARGARHLGPALQQVAPDPLALDEAVRVLLSYSLIRRDPGNATFSLHRLVQAVVRDALPAKARKLWRMRVVKAITTIFPERLLDEIAEVERLFLHMLTCISWIESESKPTRAATLLLNQAGDYLRARAQYEKAESLLKKALSIREQQLGPQHIDTAASLNSLAELYADQGMYDQASSLYQRALSIREQLLGPLHPDTATSSNDLAIVYQRQGKHEQAEALYQQALSIYEQRFGPLHPDTATSLDNLAGLYLIQGKYGQAEPLFERALSIREQRLGPLHPDTATSLNNLAALYRDQAMYDQAGPLYQRAISIYEQLWGPDHPDTATCLHNLANLYLDQEKYDQAEPLYLRVLSIRKQRLGPDNPDTGTCLHNLAALYWAQGKYDQAEPLYQRALSIRKQWLGPEHPRTALTMNNLANLYRDQGKYDQAEPLYQRALSIREQRLGPEHPLVANSLNGLAELYKAQRRVKEAEAYFQRTLTIQERALTPYHPNLSDTLYGLAALYESQSRFQEAAPLYQRAFIIRERVFGSQHPKTADTYTRLRTVLVAMEQAKETATPEIMQPGEAQAENM